MYQPLDNGRGSDEPPKTRKFHVPLERVTFGSGSYLADWPLHIVVPHLFHANLDNLRYL